MRQSAVIQRNWQSLIKPEKLEVEPGGDPALVATVVAEPLERGFGMTLGNAIRRILLSSLQGAAVTAVQIDGVLHEFSSIPGVREDVTDIVLNIKQLALRMHGEGPKRMTLTATGPGEVRAGQIQAGHDIDRAADHKLVDVAAGNELPDDQQDDAEQDLQAEHGRGPISASG